MNTIEIILAVAVFLILLGTWDNRGRIDGLQRRVIAQEGKARASATEAKEREGKNPTAKNLLGIIENLETTLITQNSQIKDLNAELAKAKFDYGKQVAERKGGEEEKYNIRSIAFKRLIGHRPEIKAKLKELGAESVSKLKAEYYQEFKNFLLTLPPDKNT